MRKSDIFSFNNTKNIILLFSSAILLLSMKLPTINTQISVLYPENLAKKFENNHIKATYALYGEIPYGSSTITRLSNFLLPDFSDPYYACSEIPDKSSNLYDEKNAIDSTSSLTTVIFVERGNCSFVTKTRNVQKAGGQLAIIMNNNNMDLEEVFLSDDGTGSDIVIPTLFISKSDGELIKKAIKDKEIANKIVLSIDFKLNQTVKVNNELFFSSDNVEMYKLLEDYQAFFNQLIYSINFKVFYVSYLSDEYSNNKSGEKENCLSAGRYCVLPRYDLGILDGRTILNENIRQKCIYNLSFQQDIFIKDYFTYMKSFHKNCVLSKDFSHSCSDKVINKELEGIDSIDVKKCVEDSYEDKLTDSNKFIINNNMLEKENEAKKKYNVHVIPGIIVNGRPIYGAIKAYNAIEAVCGAMSDSPKGYCSTGSFGNNGIKSNDGSDLSTGSVIMIILIVILINIIIVYFCKKYIVKKMHEKIESSEINGKINNVVTSYLALRDTK